MKKLILIAGIFILKNLSAQHNHLCSEAKIKAFNNSQALNKNSVSPLGLISHEKEYDIKFVHLNLNVERTTKFLSGNVRTMAIVTAPSLDTFACLLHQNHIIDSIYVNGTKVSFSRKDSVVKAKTAATISNGQIVDATVYYKGTPPTGGAAIGNGFSNVTSGSWGNQVTWSLSESLAAYHWWPCKQINTDKIDSSWVFVTTDSLNKAGSNGLLQNVVVVGNKKRYEWKSRKPIDYYLISVAVAKYKEYRIYAKPQYLVNDSILIQNYIYDNAINNPLFINGQKIDLDKIKQTMELECNLFGMYPFYKEKYGHCMAPFGGGMEHQTMTSLGFFDFYVDAHELGHQWWGDNVTCKSWGDIWLNEGFATYTEFCVAQYLDPSNFAGNIVSTHTNVMSQPGGSIFFTNHDTVDATRIFSSRLTYDKGGSIIRTLQFEVNNDSVWFNGLRGFQNTYKFSTASTVDFKTYMETFTSKNFTQFFNQWYYGEGYPTFNVKWAFAGNIAYLQSAQSTSSATSVPLFITPIEYKLTRSGAPDTVIRVMHANTVENYSMALTGTVTGVVIDPNNWIINKGTVTNDQSIGIEENTISQLRISVSPNPTKGIVNVITSGQTKGNVEVYDVNGKLIYKETLKENMKIDISDKEAAVYTIVLKDENGIPFKTEKVIKE